MLEAVTADLVFTISLKRSTQKSSAIHKLAGRLPHLWHRQGRLHSGSSFPVSWTIGGQPFGGIHVRIGPSAAILTYQVTAADGAEATTVEQEVPIVGTCCNFGGARPWFRCVACNRRVARLFYGGEAGFGCRHCFNLAFESQFEPLRLRGLAMARKIRARLGGDANLCNDFPPKPKGMHQRTYECLARRYAVAAIRCGAGQFAAVASVLARLGMRIPPRMNQDRQLGPEGRILIW